MNRNKLIFSIKQITLNKIVLSTFFVFLSLKTFTQEYIPLVTEGASWLVYSFDDVGENAEQYWNFLIKEDTIVNSKSYNKIILRKLEPVDNSDSYEILNESLFALLREEVENKQVYCVKLQEYRWGMENCQIGEEFLLYDFSYSIGDEVISCNTEPHLEMSIVIQDVQTEFLYSKTRSTLSYNGEYEKWIEGIGHSSGLFATTSDLSSVANTSLLILKYCNNQTECDILLDNKELPIKSDFKIFPNPVRTNIYLEGKETKYIQIFDIIGDLVYHADNIKNSVDVSFLNPGMYFINVGGRNVNSISAKFFKL